jgi:hypothetical protein
MLLVWALNVKTMIALYLLLMSLSFFVLWYHYNHKDDTEEDDDEDEEKIEEHGDNRIFYDMSKVQFISEIEKVGDRFKFIICFGPHSTSFNSGSIKPIRQLRNLMVDGWRESARISVTSDKDVKSDE